MEVFQVDRGLLRNHLHEGYDEGFGAVRTARYSTQIPRLLAFDLGQAAAVLAMVQIAWGVEDYEVSGGPDWLTTDWYDIEAKAPGADAARPEMTLMLQFLLVGRFKLQLRHETKSLAVYELRAGKNGPKLRPMQDGEASRCRWDNSFQCGIQTTAQLAALTSGRVHAITPPGRLQSNHLLLNST